jgi:ABC-type uncharacterized transport system involved in gliding motility auxiliary subunit
MRVSRRSRLQLRLTTASFVVLFLAAVGMVMWLSSEYHAQFDWTRSGRNSVSEATLAVLERLDKPVHISAFVSGRKDLLDPIRDLVERYRRAKPDISLDIVNIEEQPGRARDAGIQYDGELLVEYQGRKETVIEHNEEQLTNALARLGRGGERLIMFVTGHGERRIDGQANHDLATWATRLKNTGMTVQSVTLATTPQIPEDAAALVIAGPQAPFLPGEVGAILKYVRAGGNLLWLADPGPLRGLEPLAEMLGVEFEAGTVVDPNAQALLNTPPTFAVVARYGDHPATRNFQTVTVFPEAAAVRADPPEGWSAKPLLTTLPQAWVETGELRGGITFDAGSDVRGPLDLAVAVTRQQEDREQRVLVVGDGDFLSNAYVGLSGNLDLGMNLINWVSHDDAFIDIPARVAPDLNIILTGSWQLAIAAGFLFVMPLLLVGAGVTVWMRRRKR